MREKEKEREMREKEGDAKRIDINSIDVDK